MKHSVLYILGFITVTVVLCTAGWLVWINRGGDKTLAFFGKTIALPALIAGGLLVYELFLVPVPKDTSTTNIMLCHDYGLRVADLSAISGIGGGESSYYVLDFIMRGWKNKRENPDSFEMTEKEAEELYHDLLEATLWEWFAFNFASHWDIKRTKFKGIGGTSFSWGPSGDAEKSPSKYKWKDIAKHFPQNKFIQDGPFYAVHRESVSLPSGSRITGKRDEHNRIVEIRNKNIDLTIRIRFFQGGGLEIFDLGKKIRSKVNWKPTMGSAFMVMFKCEYSPWRRWSIPQKKQRAWVQTMMQRFNDEFDWSHVRERLEKI